MSDENEEEDEGDIEGDEYDKGERDEEDGEDEEDSEDDEDDEGTPSKGGDLESQEDDGAYPFIHPTIWIVNDFYLMMSSKMFNKIRDRYQIPKNIPIRLLKKFERCYFGKTVDVGIYDAMFTARLRLSLMKLHC